MLLLSRSLRRKLVATLLSAGGFLLLYQATVIDSRATVQMADGSQETAGRRTRAEFSATAYCRGTTTASGVKVRAGIAAADPKVLPLGSIVQVDDVAAAYRGVYSVLDTGPEIEGRELDLYMWNCDEAVRFGRQKVTVTVVRRGWADAKRR